MRSLTATQVSSEVGGQWQVFVYPTKREATTTAENYDVTLFRDVPTEVMSLSTTDPFGPAEATLRFPQISLLERRGSGDLWWCVDEADVDIAWVVANEVRYVWEGYFSSFDYGVEDDTSALTVSCVGALRQLDNYLAKPEYLYAPLPFERAILRQFEAKPDLRLAPARMHWPAWWSRVYDGTPNQDRLWLVPTEIGVGSYWTAMVTRYTGQWETALSGYIQQLLSSMHTERGQFTLMLEAGRQPVLQHRDIRYEPDANTFVVDLLWPGVRLSLTEDHTQKLNVVYTQGKTLSGVSYTGMQVSNDGQSTNYAPYAARRQVHPIADNDWLDTTVMRREVQIPAADGMASDDAYALARAHLQKYAHPGFTGQLILSTDPLLDGVTYPRQALTAGASVVVRSLFGMDEGMVFHVTQSSCDMSGGVSLTLDSKYRDQLTVQEVRLRGRDALTPTRMLTTGNWNPNVPDLLFPWSYEMGSGYIPWGAQTLFRGTPPAKPNEEFPWTSWTKAYPPKNFPEKYIHIGPKSSNMDNNWSTPFAPSTSATRLDPHPILMSAAGSSRLVQMAAYDEDGNVLPVSFHFSIWNSNTLDPSNCPQIPDEWATAFGYVGTPTQRGMYHPFFPNAWNAERDELGMITSPYDQAEESAQLIIGWGNGYERCGYWPGQSSDPNDAPTGLFVDEVSFSWDTTQLQGGVSPMENQYANTADPSRAMLYCMVYCEDQGAQDVYFLGRIIRAEPGTT